MLRRTEAVLRRILPPKHEVIVLLNPSMEQVRVYNGYIDSARRKWLGSGSDKITEVLPVLVALRKILFHPRLGSGQGASFAWLNPRR